jgi:hypothetical protein
VWLTANDGQLTVTPIGALQRVSRPATFGSGEPRGALYAMRLLIDNVGDRAALLDGAPIFVVRSKAVTAQAELLLAPQRLDVGQRVEGWLVFELPPDDPAERLRLDGCDRGCSVWQLDITDTIEDRRVFAGTRCRTDHAGCAGDVQRE